jgi:nitrogen-specific signal transduction histidine kinase
MTDESPDVRMNPDLDLLSALPKPVAVLSARLDVRYANAAFASLFKGSGSEAEALSRALRACPSLAAALGRAAGKLRTVGWTADARWVPDGEDGRVWDIHVTRARPDDYVVVFDEISQHLKIEEIQTRARAYLEAVLNNLEMGVIVLDADFSVTFFNRDQAALFKRLGMERSIFEIIGSPVGNSYPLFTPAEWQAIQARVIGKGEQATWDKHGYPREDPASHFLVSFVPLAAQEDRLPGAVCITEDVTRTVKLERELIEKERLALVGQMTVALNHEINNPLAAVLGVAEALLADRPPEPMAGRLEMIRDNALRISDVARRLRELEEIHLTEYVQGGPMMVDLHATGRRTPDGR